jgi:hypothetical protein
MMLDTSARGAEMIRRKLVVIALFSALGTVGAGRYLTASEAQDASANHITASDVSGTYTFLREGEFVQLTVEDGRLSGYVSRFGDTDSDKGEFIDQFFDKAALEGNSLSFNTKTVHGLWYDFKGAISTNSGKQPGQDGYHVIKGTLIQHSTDAKGNDKPMQRQVEFKSFPADLSKP